MHVLEPQGAGFLGARPAEHRAAGAGLAGHRPGRRLGGRAPDRRRNRRGDLRRPVPPWRRARAFYADVKGRMARLGRDPEHMKILPGCLRRGRRHGGGGAGEARPARQPGALRQRHRLALHRARPSTPRNSIPTARCRDIPESNAEQERPRARHRPGPAGGADGAPACPAARRLWRAGDGRHAGDDRRRDGGMAGHRRLRRLQHPCFPSCPAASTISSTRWCRSCSGAASSGTSTKAAPCARTSACRARPNRFFPDTAGG